MHVEDFASLLLLLDPNPEATRACDSWGTKCVSQKAHMVIWFESQVGTGSGAYSRGKGNDSAKAAYMRLLNPGALIWIADAFGEDGDTIARAADAAREAEKQNYRKRCGAFRAVIPWERIVELVGHPEEWRIDPALSDYIKPGPDGVPDIDPERQAEAWAVIDRELG